MRSKKRPYTLYAKNDTHLLEWLRGVMMLVGIEPKEEQREVVRGYGPESSEQTDYLQWVKQHPVYRLVGCFWVTLDKG